MKMIGEVDAKHGEMKHFEIPVNSRICVMNRPVFNRGISIEFGNRYADVSDNTLGFDLRRLETCAKIQFECSGSACNAFLDEFLKLVDKYNNLEICQIPLPEAPKPDVGLLCKVKSFIINVFKKEQRK